MNENERQGYVFEPYQINQICQLPRMEFSIWLELFRLNVEASYYDARN